jgi:hypothetical protein
MIKLIPQHRQVVYTALFSKPAFALYGKGAELLEGCFDVLAPFNTSLSEMRVTAFTPSPSDQSLSMEFGQSSVFRFKLDRIEVSINAGEDFASLPEVLDRAGGWLRSVVKQFSFQTHQFILSVHNKLSEGTSERFLLGLSTVDIPRIGISRGSGIIYHWITDQNWSVQLVVDHSVQIPDGLFIQLLVRTEADRLDHAAVLKMGDDLLTNALSEIGLEPQMVD